MHTHILTFHTFSSSAITSLVMTAESLIKLLANTFFITSIDLKGKPTHYYALYGKKNLSFQLRKWR